MSKKLPKRDLRRDLRHVRLKFHNLLEATRGLPRGFGLTAYDDDEMARVRRSVGNVIVASERARKRRGQNRGHVHTLLGTCRRVETKGSQTSV